MESEIIAREKTHYTSKNLNGNRDLPLPASELHISSGKNKKASQYVFCDKTNHESQFFKTVTDIAKRLKGKRNYFLKKKRYFRCLKAGHLSKHFT